MNLKLSCLVVSIMALGLLVACPGPQRDETAQLYGYIHPDHAELPARLEWDSLRPVIRWSRAVRAGMAIPWRAKGPESFAPNPLPGSGALEARWKSARGTVDMTGLYTAPATPGMDVLRATIKDGGFEVEDTFEVFAPPRVLRFEASAASVPHGVKVTFFWEVDGGQAPGLPQRLPEIRLERPGLPAPPVLVLDRMKGDVELLLPSGGEVRLCVKNDAGGKAVSTLQIQVD